MTAENIIKTLGLEPHPSEGGYFRRTYESDLNANIGNKKRRLLTSIYYMLTNNSPISYLHRNKSDIIHFYHQGSPVKYLIVKSSGEIEEAVLGPNIEKGERPQLVVTGGDWKASQLCSGSYCLISEAVSPGFEYDDNELANTELIQRLYPSLKSRLEKFIK